MKIFCKILFLTVLYRTMKFVSMQTLYWPGKVDHNPPETKFDKFELPTAGSNPSLIFNLESVVQI